MFELGDPEPEPFNWGRPNWATEEAYDEDLATFLGDLACGRDVPEAQTQGLARRALTQLLAEPDRLWPRLFAARLIGPDCPPAKGLPEDMRRQLEELARRRRGGRCTGGLRARSRRISSVTRPARPRLVGATDYDVLIIRSKSLSILAVAGGHRGGMPDRGKLDSV